MRSVAALGMQLAFLSTALATDCSNVTVGCVLQLQDSAIIGSLFRPVFPP
jgi:hypothetical protein